MASPSGFADRNLLFAVLAWREGLVSGKDVLDALHAWSESPDCSLAATLRKRGKLTLEEQALVETRLEEHLSALPSPPTSAPAAEPEPAVVRYLPDHLHRAGGLGEIWHARDAELERRVALKHIRDKFADLPPVRERFVREARITGWLEHPGVVPVHGFGAYADGRPYYAMRFVEGRTLTEVIREFHATDWQTHEPSERALAFRDLLGRFVSVCQTVAYAHSRGVLHRDLKPENVLVGPYGETLVVDWGLAKVRDQKEVKVTLPPGLRQPDLSHTSPGSVIGTPDYAAPEQAAGRLHEIDERTDVYLLGGILFEILTNRPPHDKHRAEGLISARAFNEAAPPALDAMVTRALHPVREERYASPADLADEVRRWLTDEPIVFYRDLVEQLRGRVEEMPDQPDLREGLARNRTPLALVLIGLQRYREADQVLRFALDDYAWLKERYPRVARYQSESAMTRIHLGHVLAALGRHQESKDEHRLAVEEYERLLATNPEDFPANLASIALTSIPPNKPPTAEPLTDVPALPRKPGSVPKGDTEAPASQAQRHTRRSERIIESVIDAGFTATELLGRGAHSNILRGRDQSLLREVVLKVIRDGAQADVGLRYLREARIVAQLKHPNIPTVFSVGRQGDRTPYVAREYVHGCSLKTAITEQVSLRQLLAVFTCVCRATAYAHRRGVLHRDVKPSNVLIGEDGGVLLIDWELADLVDPQDGRPEVVLGELADVAIPAVAGTPAYMAPEAFENRPPTRALDVYGLGATLFHVLTGQMPNPDRAYYLGKGEPDPEDAERSALLPQAVLPAVPDPLHALCARATMRDPAERYANADDLADAVQQWLDEQST